MNAAWETARSGNTPDGVVVIPQIRVYAGVAP